MNILNDNQFKISAFFRKSLFLNEENYVFPKMDFSEEMLKSHIKSLYPNLHFVSEKNEKMIFIDSLALYEEFCSDPTCPDIQVSISVYRDFYTYFLEIVR